MMNGNRGQTVLTLVVVLAAVILVWSFLAPVMNDQIASATGLTPIEAFFLNNMNLAIGLAIFFFAVAGWRRLTAQ
jgi:uncharacterized membrane protein